MAAAVVELDHYRVEFTPRELVELRAAAARWQAETGRSVNDILIEDLLMSDDPDTSWAMLDILENMVVRRHGWRESP